MHTTDSKHALPVADNLLNRQFNPPAPNQAWVADITYIRTRAGWLYLAAVLDLYSRKVVGWGMAPNMPASLVCTALQIAIVQRQPAPGLIVHSDRGSPVRQRGLPSADQSPWLGMQHESQGQLLGQCGDGALVLETEDGASLATRLRQRRRGDARRY
jgi:transposase InsO family protein